MPWNHLLTGLFLLAGAIALFQAIAWPKLQRNSRPLSRPYLICIATVLLAMSAGRIGLVPSVLADVLAGFGALGVLLLFMFSKELGRAA